eukprot:gene8010-387_t
MYRLTAKKLVDQAGHGVAPFKSRPVAAFKGGIGAPPLVKGPSNSAEPYVPASEIAGPAMHAETPGEGPMYKYGTDYEQEHGFLAKILLGLSNKPKGFPFWYKRYAAPAQDSGMRHNIPTEMMNGYPSLMKDIFSGNNTSYKERREMETRNAVLKYQKGPLDFTSPPVKSPMYITEECGDGRRAFLLCNELGMQAGRQAEWTRWTVAYWNIRMKWFRKHMSKRKWSRRVHGSPSQDHFVYSGMVKNLKAAARNCRQTDFAQYWELVRDHDLYDVNGEQYVVNHKYGRGFFKEFNGPYGWSDKAQVERMFDLDTMYGSLEDGRTRAEVTRDIGKVLHAVKSPIRQKWAQEEKKKDEAEMQFKLDNPDEWKEKEWRRRNFPALMNLEVPWKHKPKSLHPSRYYGYSG